MNASSVYLQSAKTLFRFYKSLSDKALEQLTLDQMYTLPDPDSNSIAAVMKHMSGNMRSRFTDFLVADGEKPWRNRDQEFMPDFTSTQELTDYWESGWACLFSTLDTLSEADLERVVFIRNEGQTVIEALNRQLGHYAYHTGQIVFWAKSLKGAAWKSLSIPKGQSSVFNQQKFNAEKTQKALEDILPGLKPAK